MSGPSILGWTEIRARRQRLRRIRDPFSPHGRFNPCCSCRRSGSSTVLTEKRLDIGGGVMVWQPQRDLAKGLCRVLAYRDIAVRVGTSWGLLVLASCSATFRPSFLLGHIAHQKSLSDVLISSGHRHVSAAGLDLVDNAEEPEKFGPSTSATRRNTLVGLEHVDHSAWLPGIPR